MRADSVLYAVAAAQYVGVELTSLQTDNLERFHDWLRDEASVAGGIGPNETPRLWQRHIGDSLLFARGIPPGSTCLDVGSGVGLPGIPLAIVYPDVAFVLIDRAGRRTRLLRRIVSILGLDNCEVVQTEVEAFSGSFDWLVSRASLPPEQLMFHVKRLLAPDGTAVVALSRQENPLTDVDFDESVRVFVDQIPREVLDSVVTLLRIETT